MAHDQEADDYENAERDADDNLVRGLPGGRGQDVIDAHNRAITEKMEAAKTEKVHGVTDETREALKKTPMGPELRNPILDMDPNETGNMEFNDWMSAERDADGNLIP